MAINRNLVVMVKSPRIGRVKTRLGPDIGYVSAWAFYRQMLRNVLRPLARDRRWTTWLAVSPDGALRNEHIWPIRTPRVRQGGGDLGDRMGRVMVVMPPGPVVIIGMDIPDILPRHIEQAFRELGAHDVVFGPADDGGYWLVGLKRRPALKKIFARVRWSSEHTLADTRVNLPAHWRIAELEILTDVDDGGTYSALKSKRGKL